MSLPSGTVTFLFTDIESSTRLAREHPDTWESARARHYVILRAAIETHHGHVFQIIADSIGAAFRTAGDAIRAAAKAQTDLHLEKWDGAIIKVRVGIHTGETELREGDFLRANSGAAISYHEWARITRLKPEW